MSTKKEKPFNSAFDKLAEMKKAMDDKAAAPVGVAPAVKKGAGKKPGPGSGGKASDDGLELFLRSMEGAKKVRPEVAIVEKPGPARSAAEESLALADFAGSVDFAGEFSAAEISGVTVWHVPGLNRRVLETLLFAESEPDARLDLHGLRAHVAENRVLSFIRDARRQGHRRILIITGRGEGDEGVLKQALPGWLRGAQLSRHVMAFCVAPRAFGGEGATAILLRRAR